MTALASTDVTVTASQADNDLVPSGPKKIVMATVAFGDGSLTYPTGGVPLPDKSVFGFKKQIQMGIIEDPYNGVATYFHRYDSTNHKIKIAISGTNATSGITPTAVSFKMVLFGA